MRTNLRQLGYHIGGLELQEITPAVLEAAYFDLKNSGSINGKCLCGITLFHISLSAYCMFVDTKKKELIAENPLDKVPLPKKDTKEKRTLSAAAYHELITTLVQQTACSALSSCAPP